MSLKRCFLAVTALCALVLFSCQKNVSDIVPPAPGADSSTLVKTISAAIYDDQGSFLALDRQVFDYSNAPQKITVNWTDSSIYGNGAFVETFQYDNSSRLISFANTEGNMPKKIDYQYDAGGNLAKATLTFPDGSVAENTFAYQTVNGNKVVTQYDTAKITQYGAARPRIVKYTFDDSSRLLKQFETATDYPDLRQYWYLDTTIVSIGYDNAGNAAKSFSYLSYFNGMAVSTSTDSIINTRGPSGAELYNSFLFLYRNLYWFTIGETGAPGESLSGFTAESASASSNYWKTPLNKVQHWSTGSAFESSATGLIQNTFNAAGQLTHSVYPPGFANKYGGKTVYDYTYTKVKS